MSDYYYLEFTIKLKSRPEEFLPVFVKGAIIQSLKTVFGEIGGETELDLLTFDELRQKGILRVPIDFLVKTRAALTFIAEFQGIPAVFQVNKASPQLYSLTESYIEI